MLLGASTLAAAAADGEHAWSVSDYSATRPLCAAGLGPRALSFAVNVPGVGPRSFSVADTSDTAEVAANAEYFCLAHNGENGVCTRQLRSAVAAQATARAGEEGSSLSSLVLSLPLKLTVSVEAIWAARLPWQPSSTRMVADAVAEAVRVSLRACDAHGLLAHGVACQAVQSRIRVHARALGVAYLLRLRRSAHNNSTDSGRRARTLENTVHLVETAWNTFFDHEVRSQWQAGTGRRRRDGRHQQEHGGAMTRLAPTSPSSPRDWFTVQDLLECADDRWSCSRCSRCFRLVDPEAERDAATWKATDESASSGDDTLSLSSAEVSRSNHRLSAARQCRNRLLQTTNGGDGGGVLLGLERQNRWMQFIDGKDHDRGEFAYEREPAEDLPAWFWKFHGANGTNDLWRGNASYVGLWHRAYDRMLLTCAMPLTAELIGQLWIWLMDREASYNRPMGFTPMDVHVQLHERGSSSNAMLRGTLIRATRDVVPRTSQVWRDCERLSIANVLAPYGREELHGNGSFTVWERLVAIVDRYNRDVGAAAPGSETALVAVCTLVFSIQMYHPFIGGNSRIATMLLHRELSLHGFHPVLMFNTNGAWFLVGNTLADSVDLVREGLLAWKLATRQQQQQQREGEREERGDMVNGPLPSPWATNKTLRAQHVARFPQRNFAGIFDNHTQPVYGEEQFLYS